MKAVVLLPFSLFVCTLSARGATVTRIAAFDNTNGAQPVAPLIQASDGNFYGTTSSGGDDGSGCVHTCGGTVFKMTPAGQITVLHTFAWGNASNPWLDGQNPRGGLVEGPDGWLYGTTWSGGLLHNVYGTIYKISKAGQFQKIHDFCPTTPCPDGANPEGTLALGSDGYMYGTTTAPIIRPFIFRINASGNYAAVRHLQDTGLGTPSNGLVQGSDGAFYGVSSHGTYRVTSTGGLTILHTFGTPSLEGSGGSGPFVMASDGNLYGTTFNGGANNRGTVFRQSPGGAFQKVHDISAAEGVFPYAVVQASDGNLWGMTSNDSGSLTGGAVYAINTSGAGQDAVLMTVQTGEGAKAQLVQATDGKLYGTAAQQGPNGLGTVFVVDASLGPPTPGEASGIGGTMMTVTAYDEGTGDITLAYGLSCAASDHHVVYGALADVALYQYTGQACNVGATGAATFNPGAGSRYWVVVGNTPTLEGSYGRGVGGAERPQQLGLPGCAYTQALATSCP